MKLTLTVFGRTVAAVELQPDPPVVAQAGAAEEQKPPEAAPQTPSEREPFGFWGGSGGQLERR